MKRDWKKKRQAERLRYQSIKKDPMKNARLKREKRKNIIKKGKGASEEYKRNN